MKMKHEQDSRDGTPKRPFVIPGPREARNPESVVRWGKTDSGFCPQ